MEWIKLSQYNLPPQGLKILCFNKGDVWVARRLNYKQRNYWIEFSYGGVGAIITDEPSYWMKLELLEGCTGYMKAGLNGDQDSLVTFDEWQVLDSKSHEEFVGMIISNALKSSNKRKKNNGMDKC